MIDIAMCFSDYDGKYYRLCATAMISIFENTKSDVHMHIVHDETLLPANKIELQKIVYKYNHTVSFYNAPLLDAELVAKLPDWSGGGTLYRLFLYKIIQCDKLLYLDCDIVCEQLDVKEIFEHKLGEAPLGVVQDRGMSVYNYNYLKSIGVAAPERYFYAGILLLNMRWFRQHGDDLITFMKQTLSSGKKFLFADQDVLNLFFHNIKQEGLIYLDERFTYAVGFDGRTMQPFDAYKKKLIHFTGKKPWIGFSNSALFYWKYYSKTPWGADVFDEIFNTSQDSDAELCYFFLRGNKKDLAWARRYRDLRTMGFWNYITKRFSKKKSRR